MKQSEAARVGWRPLQGQALEMCMAWGGAAAGKPPAADGKHACGSPSVKQHPNLMNSLLALRRMGATTCSVLCLLPTAAGEQISCRWWLHSRESLTASVFSRSADAGRWRYMLAMSHVVAHCVFQPCSSSGY